MAEILTRETKLTNTTKMTQKFQTFGSGRNKTKTLRLHMTAEIILGKNFIKRKYHPIYQRRVSSGVMVGKVKNKTTKPP